MRGRSRTVGRTFSIGGALHFCGGTLRMFGGSWHCKIN